MQVGRLILFVSRALLFSAGVGLIYAVSRLVRLKIKREPMNTRSELIGLIFALYLAALCQITVIRAGIRWDALFIMPRGLETIQLIPIIPTLMELDSGLWAFIYPVVGNILWFMPLGFLLCVIKPGLRIGGVSLYGFCVSLLIETLQWFFGSGISDIDDIIFNVTGAIAGFAAFKLLRRLCGDARGGKTGRFGI